MATANQEINFELAEEIALEYDLLAEREPEKDIVEEFFKAGDDLEDDEADLEKKDLLLLW